MKLTRRSLLQGAAGATALIAAGTLGGIAHADETPTPQPEDGSASPDIYTATYWGCHSPVIVTAQITDGTIVSLDVDASIETESIGKAAAPLMASAIVEANGLDVDVIAGATMTCVAILKATAMCMVQAGMEAQVAPAPQQFTPGTYSATYLGHGGMLTTSVTFDEGSITAVELGDNAETPNIAAAAIDAIANQIVGEQTIAVDGIASASYTSHAILQGIADCVTQAGGDPVALRRPVISNPTKAEDQEDEADAVVIGGGTSGLIAMYKIASSGHSVICLESAATVGGAGEIAGFAHMSWMGTKLQEEELGLTPEQSLEYVKTYADDAFACTVSSCDYRQVYNVVSSCADMVAMLHDEVGMEMTVANETQIDIPAKGQRWGIVREAAEALGAKTYLNCRVDEILTDENGAVCGVVGAFHDGSRLTVRTKAAVLASGGAHANHQMMIDMFPDYAPTTENCGNATSDGAALVAAWNAGAAKGMFGVHAHNHVMPFAASLNGVNCYASSDPLASVGNIPLLWLNEQGRRFANEEDCYGPTPGGNIIAFGRRVFNVLDQATVDSMVAEGTHVRPWRGEKVDVPFTILQEELDEGIGRGYVYKGETIEELAEAVGWDVDVAVEEVSRYESMVEARVDTDYGKSAESLVYTIQTGPFYAIEIRPRCLGSFGGVLISKDYEILKDDGHPLPGLFASGDIACGWFGKRYLDVNGMTSFHNTTSGYVAGRSAVEYLDTQ